jgi:transposase-like protein
MQKILLSFSGSIQQYNKQNKDSKAHPDPDRCRPRHCPQCGAKHCLRGHGFYERHVEDVTFNGLISVRRYLCPTCGRTLSLLPHFALPYLRFSIRVISAFLVARLLRRLTLTAAARAAGLGAMPYERGQWWVRRFRKQARDLWLSLAALSAPPPAQDDVLKALHMLNSIGWIRAHRFLFSKLRFHLLGWPAFLAPDGRKVTVKSAAGSG